MARAWFSVRILSFLTILFHIIKDRLAICGPVFFCRSPSLSLGIAGAVDFEFRSNPRFAVNIDKAIILFDDVVSGGKSQAGSVCATLGGKKRVENFIHRFHVHAEPVIAYGNDNEFSPQEFAF